MLFYSIFFSVFCIVPLHLMLPFSSKVKVWKNCEESVEIKERTEVKSAVCLQKGSIFSLDLSQKWHRKPFHRIEDVKRRKNEEKVGK